AIDVGGGPVLEVTDFDAVGKQAVLVCKKAEWVDRRHAQARGKRDDLCPVRGGGRIRHYQQPRAGLTCQRLKRRVDISILDQGRNYSYLESIRCTLNQAQVIGAAAWSRSWIVHNAEARHAWCKLAQNFDPLTADRLLQAIGEAGDITARARDAG